MVSKFTIEKVKMLNMEIFSFSIENYTLKEEVTSFSFDFDTEIKLDIKNKLVFLYLDINVIAQKKNKSKESVGQLDIEFIYLVENLNELIEKRKDLYQIDSTMKHILGGLAYSSCRGIMYAKGAGTILENAILPIVNPAKLFKANIPNALN